MSAVQTGARALRNLMAGPGQAGPSGAARLPRARKGAVITLPDAPALPADSPAPGAATAAPGAATAAARLTSGPSAGLVPVQGLAPVAPLPVDLPWQLPPSVTGVGRRRRTLYDTGAGAQRYDVDLLTRLNQEYAERPLVPSPPVYTAEALAAAARRRIGWVHDMVGLVGRRTLEIGCGNGFEVWSLAHNLGCDAHGVDVAEYEPWSQLSGPGVSFACADLATLEQARWPYPPASFDRILSFTVWEHVTHPYALLQAAFDLLRPGGTAWIRANLYAGPQASHRYRDIQFPWPHLLFSHETVQEWDRMNGREPIGLAWVNRLSWLHYEHYAARVGFQVCHRAFTETPIDEDFYRRFEDVLGRYPRTDLRRDYVLYVLRKPRPHS